LALERRLNAAAAPRPAQFGDESLLTCENSEAAHADHRFFTNLEAAAGILSAAALDSFSTLEMDERREMTTSPADEETTELTAPLTAASSERCPNCGAGMAPDQRYCIQCGERRSGGGLRDALPRTQTTAVAAAPPRRIRMSANSSFIAGIATLLIAMGVGVLIGRTGDHGSKSSGTTPYQVVIPGGAAGAAGTAGTTGTTATSSPTTKKSAAKKTKSGKSGGASKTSSTTKVKLPPPVVKVGSKCAAGAQGCQKGKFTGSFFGQ
jgi:hypothetical protein